jgi:hypothetical protein
MTRGLVPSRDLGNYFLQNLASWSHLSGKTAEKLPNSSPAYKLHTNCDGVLFNLRAEKVSSV